VTWDDERDWASSSFAQMETYEVRADDSAPEDAPAPAAAPSVAHEGAAE
jgi:hypothetical protein